jgi:hypothetical protein
VDHLVALDPLPAFNAKNFLNGSIVQELVGARKVVAKRGVVARHADVVHVEGRVKWIAKNGIRKEGAEFQSCDFSFNSGRTALLGLVDQHLASFEASVQCMVPFFCDKVVFVSESRVSRVLGIRVGKAISYSDTFKIQLHVSCGGLEVVRNSGNVMPSV